MIRYLVTAQHAYTMGTYLATWGRALRSRIEVLSYEDLWRCATVDSGTYIFSDLERLTETERCLANEVWDTLAAAPAFRLHNHPRAAMRYELQEALHADGTNRFRVYRLPRRGSPSRFPVFLRGANDHAGNLTPLLHSRRELDRALLSWRARGRSLSRLLMAEFCDTADDTGIYRKYSAFLIGDRVIPRHLIFSRDWVQKVPDLVEPEQLREERTYLETNPHADFVRRIFRIARLDYGRIDYSLVDGAPQVWEINSNPMVLMRPDEYAPEHQPNQEWFAERVAGAFEAIDLAEGPVEPVALTLPRRLLWRARLRYAARRAGGRIAGAVKPRRRR